MQLGLPKSTPLRSSGRLDALVLHRLPRLTPSNATGLQQGLSDAGQLSLSRRPPGRFSPQDGYIAPSLCSASRRAVSASMAFTTK